MAVTLSVSLTDTEQAKVTEWLDLLLPGLSPVEMKQTLEDHAKRLLRDDLTSRVRGSRRQALLDAEAAANQVDVSALEVVDPFNQSG